MTSEQQIKVIHFNKKQLFKGNTLGLISAIGYSIAPLLVIFIADSILNSFVLVTIQEFVSWLLILFLSNKSAKKFFQDIYQVCRTKLGLFVIICGLLGGPIAQVLYVLSIVFAAQLSSTATVLVNIAPIFVAIFSRIFLKEKLSFIAWSGLLIATIAVIGLLSYQIINELGNTTNVISQVIIAISLSIATAILYAVESTVMHYAMNKAKNPISDDEVIAIKAFTSSWIMLILVLPIASWIMSGYGYEGWKQFQILGQDYGLIALFIMLSALLNGGARILYFQSVKTLNGSYGMATQLSMLLWTPLSAMLIFAIYYLSNYNFGILQSESLDQGIRELFSGATEWYYYLFIIPILIGLLMMIFDSYILSYIKSKKDNSN